MLSERLSKLGERGLEDMKGSDSMEAIELGSLSGPSGGGVGS
jgi:hypothetical protein